MSPRDLLLQAHRDWITALQNRNEASIINLVSDKVILEDGDEELGRDAFVGRILDKLDSCALESIEVDMTAIDQDTRGVAARLIHRGTLKRSYLGVEPTDQVTEWAEYPMMWFNSSGKIIRFSNRVDIDALRSPSSLVTRTPDPFPGGVSPPPDGFDLKAMYNGYLSVINGRRTKEELPNYVQSIVTQNLLETGIDEYRGFIEGTFVQVEGIKLVLKELITDEASQHVAARVELSGLPVQEFLGIPPTGRPMKFTEHCLYKLDGGKIKYVWAMRDFDEIRRSMEV